jgi:hypothetical protein
MRVAVVLTGHLRCWKQVFPNFKEKVIDRYNPDIFIHTWDEEGWWIPGDKQNEKGFFEGTPEIVDQEVIDAYKPLYFVKEYWDDFNQHFEQCGTYFKNFAHRPKNILSMYYKMHQGFSLVEKHLAQLQGNYDLVIRMRPDMVFHEDLPDFNMGTFYTIAHRNHLGQGTGDLMQVGSVGQMLFFTKIICFISELYKQTDLLCPHVITEQHITNLRLNWKEFNINKTLMHTPKGAYVEMDKINAE